MAPGIEMTTSTNGVNGTTTNGYAPKEHSPKATNAAISASEDSSGSDRYKGMIAVCGMALRLPGGLTTPQQFWDFLLAKGDARGRVPSSRYNVDAYYSDKPKSGTVKTEYGYFLDDESVDLGSLDASLFSMPRAELERADPHQRQMLEVARECFEDAGEVGWAGNRIGCYMGSFGEDWCEMFAKEPQQYGLYRVSGFGDFMLANRVSYEMDLRGPSMTLRTGCSAALVAVHEACRAMQNGDCNAALVGGANLILAPGMTTAMTEQGVLASDGACKTFSAEADGYARGEAITAVFLKPVSAALRDGNPIRAVIRSTATNSDGRTPGISCPSGDAHEAMMRQAYDAVGLSPTQTAFVECHGTGTPTGDPIETNAVGRVFGGRDSSASSVYIGSVKPNMGHSEGASGLTSLIKVILALERRTVPPNIRFITPNPKIDFDKYNMVVPVEPTPWPHYRHERASVNSFGIGGSNAHAVLESPRSLGIDGSKHIEDGRVGVEDTPRLLLFSAATQASLHQMGEAYAKFVNDGPNNLVNLSHTLANRREHLPHRAFAVLHPGQPLVPSSSARAGPPLKNLVMVFTGQGAQWPQMGSELIRTHAVFRDAIRGLDQELQNMPNPPAWNLESELLKPAEASRVYLAEFAQPLTTAVQIALVDSLAALGIQPTAVVGHSSGEVAAAYAAGGLTAYEAMAVSSHRGMVTRKQRRAGSMAAIGLGWVETSKYLLPGVTIACENSPTNVTISGDVDVLEKVVAAIKAAEPEAMARLLKIDQAYHSYHMAEVGEEYYHQIAPLVQGAAASKALFFSSVHGRLLEAKQTLGPKYWQVNLESPVLFRTAVADLIANPVSQNAAFLEIGPHSALAGPVRQILAQAGTTAPYVSVMSRFQNSMESFLSSLGKLYQLNLPIDFSDLVPGGSCLADLPRYPWDRSGSSHWYESRLSKAWRSRVYPHHDLLGSRTLENSDLEPSWRNLIHLDSAVNWVCDHKIHNDVVYPFAAYIAMAGEAARQLTGIDEGFSLRHVVVSTALVLVEDHPTEVITTLRRHRLTIDLDSEWWEFSISSTNGTAWTKHCSGQLKAHAPSSQRKQRIDSEPFPRKVEARRWYDTMRRSRLNYGPRFQGLERIRSATAKNEAYAAVANARGEDSNQYHLHPTVIDVALQLLSVAKTRGVSTKLTKTFVPTRVETLDITRCKSGLEMMATADEAPSGDVRGSIQAIADGSTVLHVEGITLSPLQETVTPAKPDTHVTSRLEWGRHLDFMDVRSLIKPSVDRSQYTPLLDELFTLCVAHSRRSLADPTIPALPHLSKFRDWIFAYPPASYPWKDLTNAQITDKVNSSLEKLAGTPAAIAAAALNKVRLGIEAVFTGDADPLELLLADGTLTELYNFTDQCDRSEFLRHLAHTKPNLRILEIGAGTGATTANILKDLVRADGEGPCLYSKYTFTDISAGFFAAARERFATTPNMEFSALDISRDIIEQGFDEGGYDLVIATNVLHATENLDHTLANVRKLLHSNGRLLLQELSPISKWINYIFGLLPGWWLGGEADGRVHEPYLTPEKWLPLLQKAGFAGFDGPVFDSECPFQLNAMMVATPSVISHLSPRVAAEKGARRAVSLVLHEGEAPPQDLIKSLEARGYEVDPCSLYDQVPSGRDVLSILDERGPFFEHMSPTRFEGFQKLIQNLGDAGMLWVTRPSQMRCIDPRYAQVIGAARSIRSELSVDLATCEFDRKNAEQWDTVVDVFTHFLSSRNAANDDDLGPDFEYAVQDGCVYVGRYHPFSMKDEITPELIGPGDKTVCLTVGKLGLIGSLKWSERELLPLAEDAVEVQTYSVGLNFRVS